MRKGIQAPSDLPAGSVRWIRSSPASTSRGAFSAAGSIDPIPPGWIPIPLSQGGEVETYLESLSGLELNRSTPFQFSMPVFGTIQGNFNSLGFALCEPADPLAPPNATPPIFGCSPNVNVAFAAISPSEAILTVTADQVFAAFGGNWSSSSSLIGPGLIRGYVLFEGVTIQLRVTLVDAENGQKRFGSVDTRTLQWQKRTIDVTFGSDLIDAVAGLTINLIASNVPVDLRTIAASATETALASMPPFTLEP